jgi:DNA gyrase subunit A
MTTTTIRHSQPTQDIANAVEASMIDYAEQIVIGRAVPDCRDGLKPVHRRILHAMHELNLDPKGKTLKCARIVGEVLGKYHPHGDSSVYGALVRMAQEWAMGMKLVVGQGNFGSIDGDSPAAMRYTEAKLSELGWMMLDDIDRGTVDFRPNFDGTLQEPEVLPTKIPNLLVNGTSGIAVGMSTDVLPHNLNEICNAVAYMAANWAKRDTITVDDLMKFVLGPDLPTGGLIYRYRRDEKEDTAVDMIRKSYQTGYAPFICQAKADIEKNGQTKIVITQIPYAVSKSTILEKIAKVARDGKLAGKINNVVDESDQDGLRIVFIVARGCDPQDALNALFDLPTSLRVTLSTNHLALNIDDDGNMFPEVFSLNGLLTAFIKHRLSVITRRAQYDKEKAAKRLHIVNALLAALAHITEVVSIIRKSTDTDDARQKLMQLLKLDEIQAQAILDMQLRRLASLEVRKLQDEKKELLEKIKELNEIIGSEVKRLGMIGDEMKQINTAFPTPRRTMIIDNESGHKEAVTVADMLVPEKPQLIAITTNGITRVDADAFKEKIEIGKASGRAVEIVLNKVVVEPRDPVVLISNTGRLWYGNAGRINSGTTSELGLSNKERLVGLAKMNENAILTIGTRQGIIKRIKMADVKAGRNEGTWGAVIGLDASIQDEVLFATLAEDNAEVIYLSRGSFTQAIDPRALRFEANTVNPVVSASARGVTAIAMQDGDPIVNAVCVAAEKYKNGYVVALTDKGYAKKVKLIEFPVQGRANKGVLTMKQNAQTGLPVAFALANPDDALDLISEKGKRLRILVRDIPEAPRAKSPENIAKKFGGLFGEEGLTGMVTVELDVEPASSGKTKKAKETPAPNPSAKKPAEKPVPTASKAAQPAISGAGVDVPVLPSKAPKAVISVPKNKPTAPEQPTLLPPEPDKPRKKGTS